MKISVFESGKDRVSLVSFFGGMCFFLSLIESLIPKPLPFFRLGIANLPVLLSLVYLSPEEFFLLGLLKVAGQGLYGGTFFSFVFLFSVTGTFSSMLVMFVLYRFFKKKDLISFVGISLSGALFSCITQSLLGTVMVFGEGIKYVFPLFLLSSGITGLILGIIAEKIFCDSVFFCDLKGRLYLDSPSEITPDATKGEVFFSMVNAVFCLLFILILVCAGSDITKLMVFGLFLILNLIFPLRGRSFLWRVRRFVVVPFVTMFFIVGINLCVPFGKVLLKSGFLTITEGALREGIKRAVEFQGTVFISVFFFKGKIRLPGIFGRILGDSFLCFNRLFTRNRNFKLKGFSGEFDEFLTEAFGRSKGV